MYGVSETATVVCDHEALNNLLFQVQQPGTRAVLIGFNEYSKHLLNMCSENVVAVYDEEDWKVGIRFRDREVIAPSDRRDANLIAVCEYSQLYSFAGRIRRLYGRQVRMYYPPRLHYKPTVEIKVFEQDPVYSRIDYDKHLSPISMMEPNKLKFLSELMRAGLRREGVVVEMGCYQGGSVWHLAHVLKNLGETRPVYMFDVFETHMMHPNATMCNDEIQRRLNFYPHCILLEGLVDDKLLLDQLRGKKICFAHYDLGYIPDAVDFLWEHLVPGAPLVLDNYGHIAIEPWDLDDYFASKDAHVIRLPWSEQGIVFKPCC